VTVTQRISAPVYISVLEESVDDTQCVVTAQLQQESSDIINVDITMSVSHKDRGFVSFNPSLGVTNLFHVFQVQCT